MSRDVRYWRSGREIAGIFDRTREGVGVGSGPVMQPLAPGLCHKLAGRADMVERTSGGSAFSHSGIWR
jgi:hypothetical protein